MPQTDSALELSFRMGQALLENGAEISRVQETMERVVQSYQVESFNVYDVKEKSNASIQVL